MSSTTKKPARKPPATETLPATVDPFAPPAPHRTLCVMCRYAHFFKFLPALCIAAVSSVSPVTGVPSFRYCRDINHGDCPKYEVPPPVPEPLPEPEPAPQGVWQRVKEFLWA